MCALVALAMRMVVSYWPLNGLMEASACGSHERMPGCNCLPLGSCSCYIELTHLVLSCLSIPCVSGADDNIVDVVPELSLVVGGADVLGC